MPVAGLSGKNTSLSRRRAARDEEESDPFESSGHSSASPLPPRQPPLKLFESQETPAKRPVGQDTGDPLPPSSPSLPRPSNPIKSRLAASADRNRSISPEENSESAGPVLDSEEAIVAPSAEDERSEDDASGSSPDYHRERSGAALLVAQIHQLSVSTDNLPIPEHELPRLLDESGRYVENAVLWMSARYPCLSAAQVARWFDDRKEICSELPASLTMDDVRGASCLWLLHSIGINLDPDPKVRQQTEKVRDRAQTYLDYLISHSYDPDDIPVMLLTCVFAIRCRVLLSEAWNVAERAIRLITWHRFDQPDRCQSATANTPSRQQYRYRLCWTAYTIGSQLACALARPFALSDAEIQVPLPWNVCTGDTEDERWEPVIQQDDHVKHLTDMSSAIHFTHMARLRERLRSQTNLQSVVSALDQHKSFYQDHLKPWYDGRPREQMARSRDLAFLPDSTWLKYHVWILVDVYHRAIVRRDESWPELAPTVPDLVDKLAMLSNTYQSFDGDGPDALDVYSVVELANVILLFKASEPACIPPPAFQNAILSLNAMLRFHVKAGHAHQGCADRFQQRLHVSDSDDAERLGALRAEILSKIRYGDPFEEVQGEFLELF